jgi:hypothetical protein
MPRLRRYLPPLLILLPLVLICGKLLLTPITTVGHSSVGGLGGIALKDVDERGWPWLFQQTDLYVVPDQDRIFPEWRAESGGFSFWWLLADVAVLSTVIAAAALLLWWKRKRSGGWLRFSLAELLLLVTAAALACGWWTYHARRSRRENAIASHREWPAHIYHEMSYSPAWLRRFVSDQRLAEVFNHIDSFEVELKPRDDERANLPTELVSQLAELTYLVKLKIGLAPSSREQPLRFSANDFAVLRGLRALELDDCSVDRETLKTLANLPNLQSLEISPCDNSDADIAELTRCKQLQELKLFLCGEITDQSIDHFLHMPALKKLELLYCKQITSAGILRLAESKSLQTLNFEPGQDTKALEPTIRLLHERSPNLIIEGWHYGPDNTVFD